MANNKPASAYAKPHTMSGKSVTVELPADSVETGSSFLKDSNMSVGNVSRGNYAPTKTSGIEVRGRSKQTKGKLARGPMA
jgi:hypothetical protein